MSPRVIVFCACDRHNLGDLLFPHIAAALLPGREIVVAGLVERDLRAFGGHAVQALHRLRADDGATLLHAGGEILGCSAWQAAAMLMPPEPPRALQATLAYLEKHPAEREAYMRARLGTEAQAPYVAARHRLPGVGRIVHAGIGGVDLDRAEPRFRDEVLAALREADAVAVRDARTQSHLLAAGVRCSLLPDPAVLVAELFGERIHAKAAGGEIAALRRAFPQGWLAVQCSAEFGDDATLSLLAARLSQFIAGTGIGVALFRAGAAPWHDDLGLLQRLASRLPTGRARLVESLDIWTICALLAASRGYCGSSLHGRIVAAAFGRPVLNLRAPSAGAGSASKVQACADTWEGVRRAAGVPAVVDVEDLAGGLRAALALDSHRLQEEARMLAARYRAGFDALTGLMA